MDLPSRDIIERLDEEGNVLCKLQVEMPTSAVDRFQASSISRPQENSTDIYGRLQNIIHRGKETPVTEKVDTTPPSTFQPKVPPTQGVSFAKISCAGEDEDVDPGSSEVIVSWEPDDAATTKGTHQQFPIKESETDAALRETLINYASGDLTPVVAHMDLDDVRDSEDELTRDDAPYESGDSRISTDSESDGEDSPDDEYGRTTSRILSDDYVAQMRALEERLRAKIMVNNGQDASPEIPADDGLKAPSATSMEKPTDKPVREGGRFAEKLDVQEAPQLPVSDDAALALKRETQSLPSAASKPRVSKIKTTRSNSNAPQDAPTDQTRHTEIRSLAPQIPTLHADKIIERPLKFRDDQNTQQPGVPPAPGADDPALLDLEMRREYHRLRARQIQREGGFMRPEEEKAEIPLTEAEGGPKKMSRFKAARLGKEF